MVGMLAVDEAFRTIDKVLTITSVTDGQHGSKSLHRYGLAFDFRTSDLAGPDFDHLQVLIPRCLPAGFDLVWEKDHGHVEYDPKNGGA